MSADIAKSRCLRVFDGEQALNHEHVLLLAVSSRFVRAGGAARLGVHFCCVASGPYRHVIADDAISDYFRGPNDGSSTTIRRSTFSFVAFPCDSPFAKLPNIPAPTQTNALNGAVTDQSQPKSTQPNPTQLEPTYVAQLNPTIPLSGFHLTRLDVLGLVEGIVEKELPCELRVRSVSDRLRSTDLPEAS